MKSQGQTISRGVVKIGGAKGNKYDDLIGEMAERLRRGERWVLVHGASSFMEDLSKELNIEPKYVTSPSGFKSRFVSKSDLTLFRSACCLFSVSLVNLFGKFGINAVPLYPPDSISAIATRKDFLRVLEGGKVRLMRGNYSGYITSFVNEEIYSLWEAGAIPILPPLAVADDGEFLNVDGDRMAAAAASSLKADVLVILSNVPGLLKVPNDASTAIRRASLKDMPVLENYALGNMKRKLLAVKEALKGGVGSVIIGDSRQERPLNTALDGKGTVLCRDFMEAAV